MHKLSINYKGQGTDRVLSQIVSKQNFNQGLKKQKYGEGNIPRRPQRSLQISYSSSPLL